jgi:hypothetical protein
MVGGVNDPGELLNCSVTYNYKDNYMVAAMVFERWVTSSLLYSKEDAIGLLNKWKQIGG